MTGFGRTALLMTLLGLPGPGADPKTPPAGVTLRDGTEVRAVVASMAAGPVVLVVRRDWARKVAPDWARRWEAAEAPAVRRASSQRRARLESWRREQQRAEAAGGIEDHITSWIDGELTRLRADPKKDAPAPLMKVRLNRGDVRSVRPGTAEEDRLLRMAWVAGVRDPEAKSVEELKDALEGRGLDTTSPTPVSLDALLPPEEETDRAWLVRRAATEVVYDPGLRFLRYAGLVLPEPEGGKALNLAEGLGAVGILKDFLGDNNPGDPLETRLRSVAERGRVGALVTALEIAPDGAAVGVTIGLWVRGPGGRWAVAGSRVVRVRPADLGPNAGHDLAADPQVATAFRLIEAIGLGAVPEDVKRGALNVGAATRKALGQARSAAQADLAALAFPVRERPREPAPAAGPR